MTFQVLDLKDGYFFDLLENDFHSIKPLYTKKGL